MVAAAKPMASGIRKARRQDLEPRLVVVADGASDPSAFLIAFPIDSEDIPKRPPNVEQFGVIRNDGRIAFSSL